MPTFNTTVAVLGLAFAVTAGAAFPAPAPKRSPAMPEFALIFHPTRPLEAADLVRRNNAARDWALALGRDGKLHTASPLDNRGFVVSQQGIAPLDPSRSIASVLIVAAKDLDAAVALAKGHPGLAFGSDIEVRPVKPIAVD